MLELDQPALLGIINCTPDSFSDGGRWCDAAHAIEGGMALIEAGAVGVDVGGESTRPGSTRVNADEQIARVLPVIEGIRSATDAIITVDTTLASVAEAALDAGADAINDVAAGTEDATMFDLAAARGCGIVLMHRCRPPDQDRYSTQYEQPPMSGDVVAQVIDWLEARAGAAEARGIDPGAICIDPGLGFGKSVEQNWALIEASDLLVATGRPVMAGASRKSFIAAVAGGGPPHELDEASARVTAKQYDSGVRLFRVHALEPHRAALEQLGASIAESSVRGC